jgi:hypothetical protein
MRMFFSVALLCGALTGSALAQSSPSPSAMEHGAMHSAMTAPASPKPAHAAMKGGAMKATPAPHAMTGHSSMTGEAMTHPSPAPTK